MKSLLGLSPENLGSILQIGDDDNAFGKVSDALKDRSTLAVGPIPGRYGDGVISPANPTFGTPTFAGAAGQIQLSLKVTF